MDKKDDIEKFGSKGVALRSMVAELAVAGASRTSPFDALAYRSELDDYLESAYFSGLSDDKRKAIIEAVFARIRARVSQGIFTDEDTVGLLRDVHAQMHRERIQKGIDRRLKEFLGDAKVLDKCLSENIERNFPGFTREKKSVYGGSSVTYSFPVECVYVYVVLDKGTKIKGVVTPLVGCSEPAYFVELREFFGASAVARFETEEECVDELLRIIGYLKVLVPEFASCVTRAVTA